MYKYILLLVLLPHCLLAQDTVKAIVSNEYLTLINQDSGYNRNDSAKYQRQNHWHLKTPYTSVLPVKNLRVGRNYITVIPARKTNLALGGNYTAGVSISGVNATPLLQNEFGQLAAGSVFSYGPPVAMRYNNSVLRTGSRMSHSFSLLGTIKHEYWPPDWIFTVKASTTGETTVMDQNSNREQSFAASVDRQIHKIIISAAYNYFLSNFSNDNSNGFLNRVYENSLLTPASFDNKHRNGSFSSVTDNPYFLLSNNGHSLQRIEQTGSFSVQKKQGGFTYCLFSSANTVHQKSDQSLQPGTAFFPGGLPYIRNQQNRSLNFNAYASYNVPYNNYHFRSDAKLNYGYSDEKNNISFLPAGNIYAYRRATKEASIAYNSIYENRSLSFGLNAGDKLYHSSTASQTKMFLPDVSGFARITPSWDNPLEIKLAATHNVFYSEPAINGSYSYYMLTQLAPEDAYKFMPVTEVASFNNIKPIRHSEFTTKLELAWRYFIVLNVDMFTRKSAGDVFPSVDNGLLTLHNMADTRLHGWDITLELNNLPKSTKDFSLSNTISFYTWKNMVTHVDAGYNNIPLAGFSTVHKALIEGKPEGIIVGNTYLRDKNNKVIIGNDGFPLVDNRLSVIGDPTPEFTLKFAHVLKWKWFTLDIDWEYQKGGDIWNGTQAVLDYAGRSQTSGVQRNIKGYVFDGVGPYGGHNNVAVDFYNPSLPVEQNRWVRYGYTGVAEAYIQKADAIRVHNLSLAYTIAMKKYLQKIKLIAYAENLVLWSAYKGVGTGTLLYDQPGSTGLDFFNLPSVKNIGFNITLQF